MQQQPEDERREISYGSFLKGYFALLCTLLALGFAGEAWLGIDFYRSACILCGALFLLAGSGVPRRLYLVVRSTGWFSFIPDPRVMRVILILLGGWLVYLGVFATTSYLHS